MCQDSFTLSITPHTVFSMEGQNVFPFPSLLVIGVFLATCQQTLGVEPAHIPFAGTTLALLGIEMKGNLLSSQHTQARSGALTERRQAEKQALGFYSESLHLKLSLITAHDS